MLRNMDKQKHILSSNHNLNAYILAFFFLLNIYIIGGIAFSFLTDAV